MESSTISAESSPSIPNIAAGSTIDFETPPLTSSSQVIDPYVDAATGVIFTAEPLSIAGEVGLVRNNATSACADPPSNDQKLGAAPAGSGGIGFSNFPIRATFPASLPVGATVSVEFQALVNTPIRIRLFDSAGNMVGIVNDVIVNPMGTCGFPGNPRGRKVVTATATGPLAYAIMDQLSISVFVIDDFTFTPSSVAEIDIKPDSEVNSINPRSQGVIPVAILGSGLFDVNDVDQSTLAFGPDGASIAHRSAHFADVNDDGLTDLLAHFPTQETGIAAGDTEACLSGETLDGTAFEACDGISTVPPGTSGGDFSDE
ncbi:MAG: hypothetical protein JSW67_08190 [Candidatus Latescibacterota bacterium]|nr:MAG: hypothetical protein JSW67_08190 [Candidatus Latescibacterota bacterium]